MFFVRERPPAAQKRYGTLGKVMSFVEAEIDASYSVRAFWNPDFTLCADPTNGEPVFIARVQERSKVVWDPQGLTLLNKGSIAVDSALSKFCRPK